MNVSMTVGDHIDNRERFSLLQKKIGLEKAFTDDKTIASYAKDLGFSKRDILFLKTICSSDNYIIKKKILDRTIDLDSISCRMSDEFGFDYDLIKIFIIDIREVIIDYESMDENDRDNSNEPICSHNRGDRVISDSSLDSLIDTTVSNGKELFSTTQTSTPIQNGIDILAQTYENCHDNQHIGSHMCDIDGTFSKKLPDNDHIVDEVKIKYPNGNSFEGRVKTSNPDCYEEGTYHWFDGTIYKGPFCRSLYNEGKLIPPHGKDFKDIVDGWTTVDKGLFSSLNNGKGVIYYSNGSRYLGEFRDGEANGQGIIHFPNGDYYEGEIDSGLITGIGHFHYADGSHESVEVRGTVAKIFIHQPIKKDEKYRLNVDKLMHIHHHPSNI